MTFASRDACYLAAASLVAVLGAREDLRSRKIPNLLTGSSLVLGLALHSLLAGWKGLGHALLAGLGASALLLVMYIAGGMGAGDVKLMAAVGCLAGTSWLRPILTGTFLSGAIFGIAFAIYHRRLMHTIGRTLRLAGSPSPSHLRPTNAGNPEDDEADTVQRLSIPYAVPIAAGCLTALGMLLWKG